MQNTATITVCVWKLKLLRMETLAKIEKFRNRAKRLQSSPFCTLLSLYSLLEPRQ